MKFSKIHTILLGAGLAFAISACEKDAETDSIKQTFAPYSANLATAPVTAAETDEVHVFTFAFDDTQNTDVALHVSAGPSSTAKEGVDFEILTHDIAVPAFAGQDSFDIEVAVLQDYEDEAGDEMIYLTFTTATPSGVKTEEVLVGTIVDSNELPPPPANEISLTLRWAFSDPLLASLDPCGLANEDGDPLIDVDLTVQTEGTGDYEDDLMGYAMASLACPEEGILVFDDMEDNTTYDLDVYFYGGADVEPSDMTVFIDFASEQLDFNGVVEVPATFDSNGTSKVVLKISRAGDTITIKTAGGEVLATGSVI